MITLVLGGARSGKSEVAERIAARLAGPVTYVATLVPGDDPDLAARIEAHRTRRPAGWRTVEAGAELPAVLRSVAGPVLVDALGPWVAGARDCVDVEDHPQSLSFGAKRRRIWRRPRTWAPDPALRAG